MATHHHRRHAESYRVGVPIDRPGSKGRITFESVVGVTPWARSS